MGLYGMRWDYMEWYNVWLVVSTPLKNMSSSIGMMTFPIWWDGKNKIHVPNHQPEWIGFLKGKCENQKTPWSSWENTYGFRWTFSQQNQSIDHKTNRIIPGIGTGTWGETWGYGLAWQFKCKMNWEIVNYKGWYLMGLYGMRWDYMEWYNVWLVVSTPLKNMSSSIGMMTFPIWWDGKNKIHVPNHQPEWIGFPKGKCENQKTPWSSWENTYGFRWTFSQQNQSIDHKTNRIIPGIGTGTWGETWGYGLAWQFKCKMNWEIVNYKGWYLMGLYGMRWDYMEWYNVWLVVSTPLKNMSSSIGMMTFPIWWEKLLDFELSPPWHLYVLLLANLLAFYLTYLLALILAYLLALYLAYLLAFYLAYLLQYVLAYLLALYLAYLLAYLLTFYLAFYLANLLAYVLANILALYLAYLLAVYLTFYLAYLPAFYLAYLLAFYLAYLLAFYLANLLAFYLANILALYLAYLLAFYLTFYLAYLPAFYLAYLLAYLLALYLAYLLAYLLTFNLALCSPNHSLFLFF